MMMTFS